MKLRQRNRHTVAHLLECRGAICNRVPFGRGEHQCSALLGDQPGDSQILPLERLQRVEHQNHGLGKTNRAQRVADRELLDLAFDPRPATHPCGIDKADRPLPPGPVYGDCVAGDPGFGTGQQPLFADQTVDQGRFTDIWATDDGEVQRLYRSIRRAAWRRRTLLGRTAPTARKARLTPRHARPKSAPDRRGRAGRLRRLRASVARPSVLLAISTTGLPLRRSQPRNAGRLR